MEKKTAIELICENHNRAIEKLADTIQSLQFERRYKDEAYTERNKLVRLLASLYLSGIKKTAIEGWDEAWHWCVYIDLPNGQASWHFHIDDLPLFDDLPPYTGEWDGHTTEEKYRKIIELAKA